MHVFLSMMSTARLVLKALTHGKVNFLKWEAFLRMKIFLSSFWELNVIKRTEKWKKVRLLSIVSNKE